MDKEPNVLAGQPCPMCHKSTLTLREMDREIPHFGMAFIFSMDCQECDYHMADVELESSGKAVKYTLEIDSEADMSIRIIKSGQATIKIPHMVEVTPGPASNGYITNVEGVLNRIKNIIKSQEDDEDPAVRKKAKNQLKKLQKVVWGREKLTMIITDPSGNSAIISEKAKK
ncbi:MAG: ZPR1 zinc finger domain-containing protein [archaeon]